MATIEDTHVPAQSQPGLTRREALAGTVQVGTILALPAVVLAEHALVEGAVPSDPAFAAVVAEYEAAREAIDYYDGFGGESERKVKERWYAASEAMYRARPTSLRDIAKQIRLINEEIGEAGGWMPDATSEHVFAAIADQLEKLAAGALS